MVAPDASAVTAEAGAVAAGEGVVKRFGTTTALSSATFGIGHGVTGLLGPNGAGKTTLIGLLLGLHRADAGRVSVLGLDPGRLGTAVRERVGYAPEHHRLPPDVKAQDFVRHLCEVHGLPTREAAARASDALWQVGLGEERFRPLGTLSTGQRQRVKMAQAVAHDPALVLLDEPTDGLDPVQRDQMLALIRRVSDEFGIDVILSSHLLDEVERICDAAVILSGGTVVAAGSLDELRGDSEGLVVELTEGAEPFAAWLRQAGCDIAPDGHRLVVTRGRAAVDHDLADLVRDAAAASGAHLRRLVPQTVTLEEVFLDVSA
ncbi:MAG: ABC transporter ATP-binding protein [Acidimicrobiales bacterium]|nr:ABC transporter ATP-binding protein [Acidimicrobiales bacterium]